MTHSVLMCPPDYFEISYEINPWMSVKRQVDRKKAKEEWDAYYQLLTQKLKVNVELLPPVEGLPDMVFTANAGLVYKKFFIRSNFRFKQRRPEEPYYENWFRRKGYTVKTVDKPFFFEGEGDALFMGDEFYTGFHFRSDVEAHDAFSVFLHRTYFALELKDKRFYHLDTCFAPLNQKSALIFMPAFETYAQMVLLENIADPIFVSEKESLNFACNALILGDDVVMSENCPETKEQLERRGFKVYELNFSEFMKSGGAAKCLVLKLAD